MRNRIYKRQHKRMNTSQLPEDEHPSQAAQVVRTLLERHGIPKHRHSSFIGEFFNLSRAAAHQRVNRSSAWTLEELQSLGARFGESLADMLGARAPSDGTRATLRVGGMQVGCRVWFAQEMDETHGDAFVAMENAGAYVVVPATAATARGSLRIARFEVDQARVVPPRVAVLDDERDVTNALCVQLRSAGLDAVGYFATEELLADISQSAFDGYVIDWLLRNGNAVPLLEAIRNQPKHSAVVLLSGKMRTGSADPNDVAAASATYKVPVFEKPAHLPLILSALENDGLAPTRGADAR